MKKYVMDGNERRAVAHHEIGHAGMVYWRRESLDSRRIYLNADLFGGSAAIPIFDSTESDLLVLIGGPMAEFLSMGVVPQNPLLIRSEYQLPNSDSNRIRSLVRRLRGKLDREYLFDVQEKCREIIQHPAMWQAISQVAAKLARDGAVAGEECEQMFREFGAPRMALWQPPTAASAPPEEAANHCAIANGPAEGRQ